MGDGIREGIGVGEMLGEIDGDAVGEGTEFCAKKPVRSAVKKQQATTAENIFTPFGTRMFYFDDFEYRSRSRSSQSASSPSLLSSSSLLIRPRFSASKNARVRVLNASLS